MEPWEKQKTIERYQSRLEKYGAGMQALGWRDKQQQELRFAIISEIDDLNGKSILDVGCGFGDYYDYLTERDLQVRYTGYDIVPKLLEVARQRHPEMRFEERDVLTEEVEGSFDYVVSSGVFNHRVSDNDRFIKKMLDRMYKLCNLGVAANMMTNYVDYEEDYLYYYSPQDIFRYCQSLSRYVVLRHDYPLYEFTVYIYKEPREYVQRQGV